MNPEPPPLCSCHETPMRWQQDLRRKKVDGYWSCRVKHREEQVQYEQTEKGRAAHRRYRQTEKGHATERRSILSFENKRRTKRAERFESMLDISTEELMRHR